MGQTSPRREKAPSRPQAQPGMWYLSSWRDLRRPSNAGHGLLNKPEITPPSHSNHRRDPIHPARGRAELAEEPHLVRDWRSDAQAQTCRRGARQRSRYGGEKKLIEQAYTLGAQLGLSVWCEDEAGPFQAVPHPGVSWQPRGQPALQPHEYIRGGTTKILTLFHPATGQVRLQSAACCTNAVLHPWLRERLSAILAALPVPTALQDAAATQAAWAVWQAGLTLPFPLPDKLPPLLL